MKGSSRWIFIAIVGVALVFLGYRNVNLGHSCVKVDQGTAIFHTDHKYSKMEMRHSATTASANIATATEAAEAEGVAEVDVAESGGESFVSSWKPMYVSSCTPSMPQSWAPCLKRQAPNLELAEEVIYPDFSLKIPNFISKEEQKLWLKVHKWRVDGNDTHAIYTNQHGQNLMFSSTEYERE
eukprot:gene28087-31195_t